MASNAGPERSRGRIVPLTQEGILVEVDCSDWVRGPEPRWRGKFLTRTVPLGIVEVDCSKQESLILELELKLDQIAPAESVRQRIADLVASLNDLVIALGGPGLTCESSKDNGGPNSLKVSFRFNGPVSPAHADACRKHVQTVLASFKEISGASATIKPAA